MKKPNPAVVILVLLCSFLLSCEEEGQKYRKPGAKSGIGTPSIDANRARKQIQKSGAGLVVQNPDDDKKIEEGIPKLSEVDFIENDRHRDPFKPYIEILIKSTNIEEAVQREIKLKEYDVADLRLIGVVTNIGDPRAMVATPAGDGIVLRRGDYVGKADYVDTGDKGRQIQVNWRVARIHGSGKEEERGIYLVRDDPLTQTPNDVTRFIPLHATD